MCHNISSKHKEVSILLSHCTHERIESECIEKLFGFLIAPKCAILLFVNGLAKKNTPDNLFNIHWQQC